MQEHRFSSGEPEITSSAVKDTYRVYVGPNVRRILTRYNDPNDNKFGIQEADFDEIQPSRLFRFLEIPLHWLMNLLYRAIGNYGFCYYYINAYHAPYYITGTTKKQRK